MLELGHIRPSSSSFASPLHTVAKKSSTDRRQCGDFRSLNALNVPDRYSIPHIHDFGSNLHGFNVFSTIDLIKAFNQIPVNPNDIHKTAVITPFGLFEFLRMPFRLCNAAQTFQRFINEVLRGVDFAFAYIDDILIASKSKEEHYHHLRQLFLRLDEYGMHINTSKCVFFANAINFLRFRVSPAGISPIEDRVAAIKNYPKPNSRRSLRRFLRMFNFYRTFVKNAAQIVLPSQTFLKE